MDGFYFFRDPTPYLQTSTLRDACRRVMQQVERRWQF
jgi:hypothetical protein